MAGKVSYVGLDGDSPIIVENLRSEAEMIGRKKFFQFTDVEDLQTAFCLRFV